MKEWILGVPIEIYVNLKMFVYQIGWSTIERDILTELRILLIQIIFKVSE